MAGALGAADQHAEFASALEECLERRGALEDDEFPAATVTADPVATVRELKEQSGKDIWLWGSLKLMHSLLDAGLVDEVRMLVCPASRGKETRIFEDSQDLKLVEAAAFENGLALLRYEIKKSDSAEASTP
jgi:dihydrofolate reductase